MQNVRHTRSRAYACGVRVNSVLFMAGFTPTDRLVGVRWDRGHITVHLGLLLLGVLWGLDDE